MSGHAGRVSRPYRRNLSILLLILVLQQLGLRIMYLPLNRLIESRFCLEYYEIQDPTHVPSNGIIPEDKCKVDKIQQQLAWLFGMIETFHLVVDLVVTIPFGMLADRGHCRLVLGLNFLGFIMMYGWIVVVGYILPSLSVKFMLLGPLLSTIGGGDCVFMSTISAILTDIAPSEFQRTSSFAYMGSITYVISLISPSLAALLMSQALWLPFGAGLALLTLGIPFIALVGSYNQPLKANHRDDSEVDPLIPNSMLSDGPPRNPAQLPRRSWTSVIDARLRELASTVSGRRNLQLLLAIFFIASLASSNSPLFPQYISKRYNWTFARAGYLLSVKAAVNVTLLVVIVPSGVKLLSKRYDLSNGYINQLGAQVMLAISVLGALSIAMSSTVPQLVASFFIYALGSALSVFTLSLVKNPDVAGVASETNALDYSIVMIAKYAGNVIGLPLMTLIFSEGIGIGGRALGSPWCFSALFYGAGFILARSLKLAT